MNLRPEEIGSVLKEEIRHYQSRLEMEETGTVIVVGDGIATWATVLGIIVFVAFSAYSYWSTAHHAARDAADTDADTTS